jgi:hypothetical protein
MNRWRVQISPRKFFTRAAVAGGTLALAVSLLTGAGMFPSTITHAQTKRLETFVNFGDQLFHRGSDDGGVTWSGWAGVDCICQNFDGAPAVVNDRPGHLMVVAKRRTVNELGYYEYFNNGTGWRAWRVLTAGDGRTIGGRRYTWISDPAVSSWGSGRFDVFVHAMRDDGAIALVHTWANNNAWTGTWEVLGTGLMQGAPAAISWGSGRIDVFVRGGGGELVHKWFDGHWSGWNDMGGVLTSNIAVASANPGHVEVFVYGTDQSLWHQWGDGTNWTGWLFLGRNYPAGTSPTATSRGVGNMDVFAFGPNSLEQLMDHWAYNAAPWAITRVDSLSSRNPPLTAVFWTP